MFKGPWWYWCIACRLVWQIAGLARLATLAARSRRSACRLAHARSGRKWGRALPDAAGWHRGINIAILGCVCPREATQGLWLVSPAAGRGWDDGPRPASARYLGALASSAPGRHCGVLSEFICGWGPMAGGPRRAASRRRPRATTGSIVRLLAALPSPGPRHRPQDLLRVPPSGPRGHASPRRASPGL